MLDELLTMIEDYNEQWENNEDTLDAWDALDDIIKKAKAVRLVLF